MADSRAGRCSAPRSPAPRAPPSPRGPDAAAAISASTGTCLASLWPPMKLYFGNPFHLTAGAGVPGARNGAKSKGAVMAFPRAFLGLQTLGQVLPIRNRFDVSVPPHEVGRWPRSGR